MFDRCGGAFAVGERGEHERLSAVARDEHGQVRGRIVERALEPGLVGEQRDHMRGLRLSGRIGADVGLARHERRDAVVGGLAGGAFDRAQDLLVLGVRVLEVRGFALEDRDDGYADRGGE